MYIWVWREMYIYWKYATKKSETNEMCREEEIGRFLKKHRWAKLSREISRESERYVNLICSRKIVDIANWKSNSSRLGSRKRCKYIPPLPLSPSYSQPRNPIPFNINLDVCLLLSIYFNIRLIFSSMSVFDGICWYWSGNLFQNSQ